MSDVANRYTLKFPIALPAAEGAQPELLTEVAVRSARGRDLLAMDTVSGQVAKAMVLLARLTGIDRTVLSDLHVNDFEAPSNMIGGASPAKPA